MNEQTPEQTRQKIDTLQLEIAALEAQEAAEAAAEEAAAPVIVPSSSLVQRIMPTSQFQTPGDGTDVLVRK